MYSTTIDGLPHEFTDAEKIEWLALKGNYLIAKKYHKIVHTKTSFNDLVDIADKIQKIERVAYKRAHGGKPPTPLRDSLRSNPRGWTWAHAKARSYAKSKRKAAKKRNPAKRPMDIVNFFRSVRDTQRKLGHDLWAGLPEPKSVHRKRKAPKKRN